MGVGEGSGHGTWLSLSSHLMACRIPTYDCIILFGMCELWNMTIACALR